MIDLVFLVSDSRSGSTFLSRLLHRSFPGLAVTPEVSLKWLLVALRNNKRDRTSLLAALERGRFFESLGLAKQDFPSDAVISDGALVAYIRQSLAGFVQRSWPDRAVSKVVVKKGHHAMDAAQLAVLFPEALFLCLYRDPRAVFESKRRTQRPYFPGETMGWAGTALTTYRWCQYTNAMTAIEQTLHACRIRYEDLAAKTDSVLDRVSSLLVLQRAPLAADDYRISRKEQSIHSRSVIDSIAITGLDSWEKNLTTCELGVVEAVAKRQMQTLGYAPRGTKNAVITGAATLASGLYGLYAIMRRKLSARTGPVGAGDE